VNSDASQNPGIDWNNNNDITPEKSFISAPIQNIGIPGCDTYTTPSTQPINDYNDWINLNYNYTAGQSSFNGMAAAPAKLPEMIHQK